MDRPKVNKATFAQIEFLAQANGWIIFESFGLWTTGLNLNRMYTLVTKWITQTGTIVEIEEEL